MASNLVNTQLQASRMTELEQENQQLRAELAWLEENYRLSRTKTSYRCVKGQPTQNQARLLSTVAQVANLLLRASDYKAVLPEVVRLLGEVTGCDRCAITQEIDTPTPDQHLVRLVHEWCRVDIPSVLEGSPEFEQGIIVDTRSGFESRLWRGEAANFVVSELDQPEWIDFFTAHHNTSMLIVPVMIEGQCWGHIGFNNCGEPRLHDAAEVAILQVAAESIAAAVERQAKDNTLRQAQQATFEVERAKSRELESLNTELQQTLTELAARDRILEATTTATNALLTVDSLDEAVNTALRIIGEALETDRVNILENFELAPDSDFLGWRHVGYEWTSSDTVLQHSNPATAQGSYEEIQRLYKLFQQGKTASYLIEDMPEPFCSAQMAIGVKATHLVPIFVEGQWWGVLGLDDCQMVKQRSAAELSVLKVAADCVGSAIQRERTQQSLQQARQAQIAEQARNEVLTQRDQLLNASAASVSSLLTVEDLDEAINLALKTIGEALDTDRAAVVEFFYPNSDTPLPNWRILHEWNMPNTPSQLANLSYAQGTHEGVEALLAPLTQGESFSVMLEAMEEPFRSKMAALGVRAMHNVPIFVDDCLWGSLGFDECRVAKPRSSGELSLLRMAADCIGSAIARRRSQQLLKQTEQARAVEQALLKAEQDRVLRLAQTNQALKNSLDRLAAEPSLDAFLGHVLTEIAQQLDIHTSWLHLYDSATETLQLRQWVDQGTIRQPQHFSALGPVSQPIAVKDTAIWNLLLETRRPFVITTGNAPQYLFPGTEHWQLQWAKQHGMQAGINILLILGDTPLGILALASAERSEFTLEELEHTQAISQQATLAIQLTRLAEEARHAALHEERNRLAGEIHDSLAQTFTGISVQLELARYLMQPHSNEVSSVLDRISSLTQTGLVEARRSVWSIYPEDKAYTNLGQELADCVNTLTQGTDLETYIQVSAPDSVSYWVGKNLLRIGQEAVINSLKHAQANELRVNLHQTNTHLSLRVRDNGCGFSPYQQTDGFGLIGISERTERIGGTLQILAQPSQGTDIFVQVPL